MSQRINVYIRDLGLASRREADALIESGVVFINGKRAVLGSTVNDSDKVEVRQKKQKEYTYLAYNKPRGLSTQATSGDDVVTQWQKKGLFPVGRLDKESEGLLLLTNDGRLTTKILGPDSAIDKEYRVTVREELKKNLVAIFAKGMDTRTFGTLLPAKATILGPKNLRVSLREGKKHQIRVMLSDLGYTTTALTRIRIGAVSIGKLPPGATRPLTPTELKSFGL